MEWLISHFPIILAISYGIFSEALAIVQQLKYPTNSGVGGVISAIIKVLQSLGAKAS